MSIPIKSNQSNHIRWMNYLWELQMWKGSVIWLMMIWEWNCKKKTTRYWGSTLEFLMSHCVNNFKTLQHGIAADSVQEKKGDRKMSSAIKWFLSAATSHRRLWKYSFFLTRSIQDCDKNLKLNFHITVCSKANYNEWVIPCSDYYHSCVRRSRISFFSPTNCVCWWSQLHFNLIKN